jgi:hypothetical protein
MKRDKRLQILFSEREYNKLKRESEKLGVPMAEVVRDFVKGLPDEDGRVQNPPQQSHSPKD